MMHMVSSARVAVGNNDAKDVYDIDRAWEK
jgi:hypothetical protein